MINKQWNPAKVYKDARAWIASSRTRSFDEPREVLRKFAKGEDLAFGLVDVAASLHDLAVWHETAFIVEADESEAAAAKLLTLSFDYNFWEAIAITRYWSSFDDVPFGKGLDEYSAYLSKGLSIGHFGDAKCLGNLILQNKKKKGWFTGDGNAVTNFVLGMFCKWQGLDWSEYRSRTRHMFYSSLIDRLFETEDESLESLLREACDFHIAQSRNLSEREHPEFDRPFARVYPAEILAFLSVRRSAGLSNQDVDHPLMKLTTSTRTGAAVGDHDELLSEVKQKLMNDPEIRSLL